jgi:transposase
MAKHSDASKQRRWLALIQLWQQSDLSIRAFCRLHSVSEPSFYVWRRSLTQCGLLTDPSPQPQPVKPSSTPVFLQLSVPPTPAPATPSPIDLVLNDHCLLRLRPGFDPQSLLQLLRLLEEPPC